MSEINNTTNVTGPCVLVPLSEYGEFFSLLGICENLEEELGLHPIFVFGPDYGLSEDHGKLVKHRNWSWLKLGSKKLDLFFPSDLESKFGYFQSRPIDIVNIKTENALSSRISKEDNFDHTKISANKMSHKYDKYLLRYLKYFYIKSRISKPVESDEESFFTKLKRHIFFFRQANYKKLIVHSQAILKVFDIRLVVSGQDFAGSVTSIVASTASKRGISTAIVPYSMAPTTKEIIESLSYLKVNFLRGFEKWCMAQYYPSWINIYRGEAYGRNSLLDIIEIERNNLAPPLPWTPNSGHGIIFSPSQRAMDYYLQSGIPKDKLLLTGAEWSDHLVRNADSVGERKNSLLTNAKSALTVDKRKNAVAISRLKNVKNIFIVSWPPNQYPRKAFGAETFQELCTQFIQALRSIQERGLAYVVVSLHPTLLDEKLAKSIRAAGLYLMPDKLIDVIDCADVFCSTVSSTNFWSLQCGIPTINFDGFLYGYSEFDEAGGLTVENASAMQHLVGKLLTNPEYYQDISKKIIDERDEWVMRDGQCSQRIIEGLSNIVK